MLTPRQKIPALFSEPRLFLARPDGTLYQGAVQTMAFAGSQLTNCWPPDMSSRFPAQPTSHT